MKPYARAAVRIDLTAIKNLVPAGVIKGNVTTIMNDQFRSDGKCLCGATALSVCCQATQTHSVLCCQKPRAGLQVNSRVPALRKTHPCCIQCHLVMSYMTCHVKLHLSAGNVNMGPNLHKLHCILLMLSEQYGDAPCLRASLHAHRQVHKLAGSECHKVDTALQGRAHQRQVQRTGAEVARWRDSDVASPSPGTPHVPGMYTAWLLYTEQ